MNKEREDVNMRKSWCNSFILDWGWLIFSLGNWDLCQSWLYWSFREKVMERERNCCQSPYCFVILLVKFSFVLVIPHCFLPHSVSQSEPLFQAKVFLHNPEMSWKYGMKFPSSLHHNIKNNYYFYQVSNENSMLINIPSKINLPWLNQNI